jgi:DNA gyrase subunit A
VEYVLLSATGRLGRVDLEWPYAEARAAQVQYSRAAHDVIRAAAPLDAGAALVTSAGRAIALDPAALPRLAAGPWSLAEAPAAADLAGLAAGEAAVGLFGLDLELPPLALGTRDGVVKRVVPEYKGWDAWEVIALKEGDAVVGAAVAADADEVVLITSDGQLLRSAAREVRAQGRAAGGMAGIKLAEGARVLAFAAVAKADRDTALVATLATGPRPDAPLTAKVTPFALYPAKGRATGGVRCHRFLKDQDRLALAWAGLPPARAADPDGNFRNLPAVDERRDGTGTKVYASFAYLG